MLQVDRERSIAGAAQQVPLSGARDGGQLGPEAVVLAAKVREEGVPVRRD